MTANRLGVVTLKDGRNGNFPLVAGDALHGAVHRHVYNSALPERHVQREYLHSCVIGLGPRSGVPGHSCALFTELKQLRLVPLPVLLRMGLGAAVA